MDNIIPFPRERRLLDDWLRRVRDEVERQIRGDESVGEMLDLAERALGEFRSDHTDQILFADWDPATAPRVAMPDAFRFSDRTPTGAACRDSGPPLRIVERARSCANMPMT